MGTKLKQLTKHLELQGSSSANRTLTLLQIGLNWLHIYKFTRLLQNRNQCKGYHWFFFLQGTNPGPVKVNRNFVPDSNKTRSDPI